MQHAVLAALAFGCALGVPSAQAAPRIIQPLQLGAQPTPRPGDWFYRDRVIDRPPAAMAAVTRGFVSRYYRSPDGQPVLVTLSSSFPDIAQNRSASQSFVTFLGTRVHGPELKLLRVFIGTPGEIAAACGGAPGVLACYSRLQRRMYVPDRDPQEGGPFTREYAVTHEYGHHVAASRSNYPFSSLNYGAKYWSSDEYVCARASRGLLFPGNQTSHYSQDSGEGFADTYAHLHYTNVIWQFADILRPNAGSLAAVRRDVLAPWRGPAHLRMSGFLSPRAAVRSFAFHQSLDGVLSFRLAGPARSSYDILLVNRGRVVRRTTAGGSRDVMSVLSCRSLVRTAPFTLRVVRRTGSGPFTVSASIVG